MKKHVFIATGSVLTGLFLAGCATLAEVELRTDENEKTRDTIKYSLPRTVVTVVVPIKKTELKPSRFQAQPDYLASLKNALGVEEDDIVKAKGTTYEIVNKEVVVGSRSEADPSASFIVHVRAAGFQELKLELELGENGQFQAVTNTVTHKGVETAIEAVGTAVGLASKFAGPPQGKIDEELSLKGRIAEVVAIRKSRMNLISNGIQGGSAEQLKLALESLQAAEKAILNDLLGTTKETVWSAQYSVVPTTEKIEQILLKLDSKSGVTFLLVPENGRLCPFLSKETPDFAAETLTLKVAQIADVWGMQYPVGSVSGPTTTTTTATAGGTTTTTTTTTLSGTRNTGSFFYRNPGRASVVLESDASVKDDAGAPTTRRATAILADGPLTVAQYGEIRQLPRRLGGTSNSLTLALYPETGAIKKISTTASPADVKAAVTALGAKAGAYIDASQKAVPDPEMVALQLEHDKLKLQAEMVDYRSKISPP